MRAVVSASGWPLRLVRWPGAWYSVGAVEVPAGFPAGERAAGLTGRRAECGVLDRLVEAVQAGESRALDFPAAAVNVKWYGDGTDIDTDEGKLYLDSVLDVGSRRVLGFALASTTTRSWPTARW